MPLSLEIVTPAQRVLTVQCDEVRLPGSEGSFGVRPGHTPLVAALAAGELAYETGGATHRYSVGEGFAEVSDDRARVLVEEAVRAEDLDAAAIAIDLADRTKKLGEMKEDDPSYDLERAKVARSAARALVAGRR